MSADSLNATIARDAIPFSLDDAVSIDGMVDRLLAAIGGERIRLLGLGEPTHGIEEPFALRNAMFRALVVRHRFTAIAIESSFPRGRRVNDYIHGRVNGTFDAVRDSGFSHDFGKPAATRELIDWMRDHNAAASTSNPLLNFYGFDGPMEMMHTDSPHASVDLALEALAKLDAASADGLRVRIEPLIGDAAAWANPQANMNASESIGDSPAARALHGEVERLIQAARDAKHAPADAADHLDAVHFAESAARLLDYHHAVATLPPETRISGMLSLRDAIMGEHLNYIVKREALRGGRVLAFAHNSHLQKGMARWQWGPNLIEWKPAGSHMAERLGDGYGAIATAAGAAPTFDIAMEPGTLEAVLCAAPGPARATLTRNLRPFAGDFTPHTPNPRYFPLTPQHLIDFDAIVTFDKAAAQRQ